ncbi:hypothetical protein K438DRAFT_2027271 [Mycena galopus ATCC 62051]|nr:hypothetical protein K438DRAFT_2027271 [Mycena galopus ATCC 62051]
MHGLRNLPSGNTVARPDENKSERLQLRAATTADLDAIAAILSADAASYSEPDHRCLYRAQYPELMTLVHALPSQTLDHLCRLEGFSRAVLWRGHPAINALYPALVPLSLDETAGTQANTGTAEYACGSAPGLPVAATSAVPEAEELLFRPAAPPPQSLRQRHRFHQNIEEILESPLRRSVDHLSSQAFPARPRGPDTIHSTPL